MVTADRGTNRWGRDNSGSEEEPTIGDGDPLLKHKIHSLLTVFETFTAEADAVPSFSSAAV